MTSGKQKITHKIFRNQEIENRGHYSMSIEERRRFLQILEIETRDTVGSNTYMLDVLRGKSGAKEYLKDRINSRS